MVRSGWEGVITMLRIPGSGREVLTRTEWF